MFKLPFFRSPKLVGLVLSPIASLLINPRCWDYLNVSDLNVSQGILILVLVLWFQFVLFGKKSSKLVQQTKHTVPFKLCSFQVHVLIKCLVFTLLIY